MSRRALFMYEWTGIFTNKLTNGTKNGDIKLTLYPIWHYIRWHYNRYALCVFSISQIRLRVPDVNLYNISIFVAGDRIVHVNGESAVGLSYSAVVNMVKRSREALQLIVVAQEDDILQSVSKCHFISCRWRLMRFNSKLP